jgi:hypothetical protein
MISLPTIARADSIPTTPQHDLWRQSWGALAPILIIYCTLAFFRIGDQSLWGDEIRSLESAAPNGPLFNSDILFRGQGPLYFAVLHFWAKLSTSEAFLRTLSVLMGGVGVVHMYAIGLRMFNRQVALIGATLFATSPFLIWYSQEVRYVILMITTALLAMFLFARVLFAKRLRGWFAYCSSLILALGASPINVFLLIAQGLYLACSPSHHTILRKWVLCQLLVFAVFAWWANGGQVWQLGGYWERLAVHFADKGRSAASPKRVQPLSTGNSRDFSALALPYTLFAFSTGYSLGPSVRELHISRTLATMLPHASTLMISSLLFGGLFLGGCARLWRRSDHGKFFSTWLAVPIIGVLGLSALIPTLTYNVRYVAMSVPAFFLMLALGIVGFKQPVLRYIAFAAVLLVNGVSLANYYFDPRYSREDARGAARFLEEAAQPRDIILVIGNTGTLKYYYKAKVPVASWDRKTVNDPAALSDRMQGLSQRYNHVWLVELRPWQKDRKGVVKAALEARFSLVERKTLAGVDIYSFSLQ